ncbi:hypothetical protein EVJ58_g9179 [Rhodofomes roseus]|uniref:Uncharacterized protein n=1 Tax=Rhodofomes roseus TaxID=34475 RepID=A0A4Y9XWZ5_9APHY|nr:hypothetical protein EVJ58_g9179 [Rhodofomes roseus]
MVHRVASSFNPTGPGDILFTEPLKVDQRKRRRVADDLGEENSPSTEARKQNVSPILPDVLEPAISTPIPSASTPSDHFSSAGPSKPRAGHSDSDSIHDISFAIASDSARVESLLARRSDSFPMLPSINLAASTHRGASAAISSKAPSRKGKGKTKPPLRLGDFLPLFPLPPSSIPTSSPHTPSPSYLRRPSATPVGPKRGHHWADISDSEEDAKPSRPSQRNSSPPEIVMADTTPTPSIARYSSIDSDPEELEIPEVLPFNVDDFEPDVVIPTVGTWRPSQGDSANWKERGMVVKQRLSWTRIAELQPTLGLQIAYHGSEEPGVEARITKMLDVFHNTLHAPNASIFSSYSATGFHGMNLEPYWYLVTNLSILIIIELVRIGWMNLTTITLNFAFWSDPNPHLCASFRLIHRFGAQTKDEYEHLIRREILESDLYEITFEVLSRDIERGGMWSGSRKADAIGEMLDSIDVDVVPFRVGTNATEPIAVIYMKPPTADRRDWLRFSSKMKCHGFGSDLTGHPEPFAGRIWCGYCHSLGHTPATCSVRQTLGWHDIPLQQVPNQLPPPYNAGRGGRGNGGNGGRGTGRGRGVGRGRGGGGNH